MAEGENRRGGVGDEDKDEECSLKVVPASTLCVMYDR
jgi:hypothetical protein